MNRIWQYRQPFRLNKKTLELRWTFINNREVEYQYDNEKVKRIEVNPLTAFYDIKKDIKKG